MHYRLLASSDYIDCIELLDKISDSRLTAEELSNYYFDDNEDLFKIFGAFDEFGVLHSCVFVIFSNNDRSYYIKYVVKQLFSKLEYIVNILDFVFDYAESINYFKLYVSYVGNSFRAWERLVLKKSSRYYRYNIFTEEIIPANKKSSFIKYWIDIQDCKICRYPVIIRIYLLEEKYRGYGI